MLNGSVPAECSVRLWVVSGPGTERQSTGGDGCVALGVDGDHLEMCAAERQGFSALGKTLQGFASQNAAEKCPSFQRIFNLGRGVL